MSLNKAIEKIGSQPSELPTFIKLQEASDNLVYAVIVSVDVELSEELVIYSAYYGSCGGGEYDGGYVKNDVEAGEISYLSYDDIDALGEESPEERDVLEALMVRIWALVDDEEGDLELTEAGRNFVELSGGVDGDSVEANNFDGADFADAEWVINLHFDY
jgi:hypothetical protein